MKFRYTLSLLISCLLSLAFLSSPAVAEPKKDGPRRSIVFFGDSLSDTGNRYFDERIKNTPPYDLAAAENLVPSYPYAIGGPTYTNGRAWPTHFARALGDPGSAQPALRNNPRALNYAYAGARASNDPPLDPNTNRNLSDQVSQYLADQNGQAYADALHVVFIGGNDVAEAIGAYLLLFQQDPGQAQGVLEWIIGNAVTSTFANALELRQAGAKRFLLILAPNVGYSPLFEAARPFSPLVGAGAANGFNCAIAGDGVTRTCAPSSNPTLVQVLQASGAEVNLLDSQALFDAIIANSAVYGLTNTTDHCIQPNVPPYQCTNEDEYVYWDNIHPTGRIHEIIGQAAAAVFAD